MLDTHRWTDERVEQLRCMWADGFSAVAIATHMGGGLTRNAVIGKISRLKLPKRLASSTDPQHIERRAAHKREGARAGRKGAQARNKVREEPKRKPAAIAATHDSGKRTVKGAFEADPAGAKILASKAWNALPGTSPVSLIEVKGCRWPVGDEPLFCNERKHGTSSYCRAHAKLAGEFRWK